MRPIEEVTDEGIELARVHANDIKHAAIRVGAIFVIALLLEVFLFNMNFFISSGYERVNLTEQSGLALADSDKADSNSFNQNEPVRLTATSNVLEFHDLNKEVHNIHLDFDNSQSAQNVTIQISFTDSAHETYFNTTEYTFGVPEVDVSTFSEESQYLYLQSSGHIQDLRIEIVNEDATYPLILNSIVINDPQPFAFNGLRFFAAFVILLFVYVFRPKSSIYRCKIKEHPDLVEYALLQQRRLKYLSLQHICFLAQTKWVLRQPTIIPALGMGIVSLIPTKWAVKMHSSMPSLLKPWRTDSCI